MDEFVPREVTKEEQLYVSKKVEVNSFGITYDSLDEIMKFFTYMDNRSCTCIEIISYIFWQISQHIYQISITYKFNKFSYTIYMISSITIIPLKDIIPFLRGYSTRYVYKVHIGV